MMLSLLIQHTSRQLERENLCRQLLFMPRANYVKNLLDHRDKHRVMLIFLTDYYLMMVMRWLR